VQGAGRTEAGNALAAEHLESGFIRDVREEVGRAQRAPDERALERRQLIQDLLHLVLCIPAASDVCEEPEECRRTHVDEEPACDEVLQLRESIYRTSTRQLMTAGAGG
jgi:hypothetical protein